MNRATKPMVLATAKMRMYSMPRLYRCARRWRRARR
jgi:hypothetical protein